MSLCTLCTAPVASIVDREWVAPERAEGRVQDALVALETHPLIIRVQLFVCGHCRRRYRIVGLPVEEDYPKTYLRAGK